jgi:XTP/dITP diphosphohydrolase
MKRLLIATSNPGKVREFKAMLADVEVDVVGLDLFDVEEVAETGSTFAENAALKASGYARQVGLHAIADDSGLEVNALGGRPGVLSARYGGDDLGFDEKMEMLRAELDATGSTDRRARFVSAVAFADERGNIIKSTLGTCEGTIAQFPRGSGGFGYDPIFIPEGYTTTFGELSDEIKAQISHRARSFGEIIPFLRHFIANRLDEAL